MNTIHQPPGTGTDPLPEPGTVPYFRRELDLAAARRGLPYEAWSA